VARELGRRLREQALVRVDGEGTEQFWTSADPVAGAAVFARLWRPGVQVESLLMPSAQTA